jgi:hypothetical protein
VHAELAALYLRQSQRTGRRELCRQAETEAEAEMASYAGDAGAERILQQARRLALSQLIASLSRPAPSPQLPAWLRPAPRILPSPLLPPVHRFDPASLQPAPRFRRPFWFPTAHSAFIPPAEPAWRRYRELFPIAGRSFSFLMPAAPRRELPQKNYERWDCTVEGTRYSVTHWKITDHGGDARTVLEGLGRSWKRCQLFFERPITLDGFTPGREMKYTIMPAAEQHAQAAWTRYYAAGESLYRIAVYVPAGTGWPGDAEKFLDSFRFE